MSGFPLSPCQGGRNLTPYHFRASAFTEPASPDPASRNTRVCFTFQTFPCADPFHPCCDTAPFKVQW